MTPWRYRPCASPTCGEPDVGAGRRPRIAQESPSRGGPVLLTFSRPHRTGRFPAMTTPASPFEGPTARVTDLSVTFQRRGVPVRALRGVSLEVGKREILAVVGESGSGKSVLGLTLLGLLDGNPAPEIEGRAEVCGIDMVSAMPGERRLVRRDHMGAVFQDPMTSLNPTMKI